LRTSLLRAAFLAAVLLVPRASVAQGPPQICFTTMGGPFTVTSGAPFNIQWIMADTVSENSATVPTRINGFYVQIDGGEKYDIGMATALPTCPSTSTVYPNDLPFTFKTTSGVARGPHTLKISAWNFVLDSAGDPTTTKQESVVVSIPFSAGEPTQLGPPVSPANVVIIK
jgi:hypothetical protein